MIKVKKVGKPLIVPISPYHKKGCGVGKKTFGPEKVNDSLKFIGQKWQNLELKTWQY